MLNRKNYDAVAEIFRVAHTPTRLDEASTKTDAALDGLEQEQEFAIYFASDNGRLDWDRVRQVAYRHRDE